MRTVDLGYVLGSSSRLEQDDIQVLSAMLVQKDSAHVLVNMKTRAAILFREAEMRGGQGDIYLEDFDVFTKEYYESYYYGEDLNTIIEVTRMDHIIKSLQEDRNLEYSYSVLENGTIHRKNISFQFIPEYQDLLCIFNFDITEAFYEETRKAKVVEEALELVQRANKTKSDFLMRLSTDLRSPIYSINTLADYALECDDLDKMREYLVQIKQKSMKFTRQVNAMMNLSVVDKGELELNMKPLVLRPVLDDIADTLKPLARKNGISLILEVDNPKLPVIMMDPIIIKEAFLGLLQNAIEYGHPGGYAKLSITSNQIDENHVEAEIVISDDGPGISPEDLQKLGQEFIVTGKHLTDEVDFCLAIPLTQAFVERLGGSMKVESKLGEGTIVTINVVVEKADTRTESYAREIERMIQSVKKERFSEFCALIADDDDINRQVTQILLQKIGLRVETAKSCEEVIEKLVNSPENYYHVVFMDVNMFNLDGKTATMTIRELDRHDLSDITIVGTTAYELRDERIRTLESGMDYHLPIPLEENEIRDILIRELLNLNPQKESEMRRFRIVK